MENRINVEIVCIRRDEQIILPLQVPKNSTIRFVIEQSELFTHQICNVAVGIFGKIRHLDFMVSDGDRIEIYRPLVNDPKIARANKVQLERRARRLQRQKSSLETK